MSRYGFEESIRDGATLKLHFEPRLIDLHIDKAAHRRRLQGSDRRPVGPGQGQPRQDRRQDGRAGQDARAHPQGLRGHRRALPDARWSPTASRARSSPSTGSRCLLFKAELDKLLPPEATDIVMSVQAADKKDHPEYAQYDRSAGRRGTAARPLPRPGRPAEADHRHGQAADRLRRAHPAGDVPGQAAARPHAAAGHLPREPHLLRAEDPRPDRGLPRHLRRRGGGAGVRRPERQAGGQQHPGAEGQAARSDAEVPGLLPWRRPHASRATRA